MQSGRLRTKDTSIRQLGQGTGGTNASTFFLRRKSRFQKIPKKNFFKYVKKINGNLVNNNLEYYIQKKISSSKVKVKKRYLQSKHRKL